VRSRGSRGLGGFWHQEDECSNRIETTTLPSVPDRRGNQLFKGVIRGYVKVRIRCRFRRRLASVSKSNTAPREPEYSDYQPRQFRYNPPPLTLQDLILERLDFELWINELWHDFLIEPTPYLVASAIAYLGCILLLSQYYAAIWQLSCFFLQFVPWDDEFGLG
jgi:hypothetical protein